MTANTLYFWNVKFVFSFSAIAACHEETLSYDVQYEVEWKIFLSLRLLFVKMVSIVFSVALLTSDRFP